MGSVRFVPLHRRFDVRRNDDLLFQSVTASGENQDLGLASPEPSRDAWLAERYPHGRARCPKSSPSSATPFGFTLETVSLQFDHLRYPWKPLSFRSGRFSHPFTLLHTCILNPDGSTPSDDEASTPYRTLYYPYRSADGPFDGPGILGKRHLRWLA